MGLESMKREFEYANQDSLFPNFSIIIEWENTLFSESWRARKMLQQLCKQINESSNKFSFNPEILIVYSPEVIEDYKVEQFVREQLKPCLSLIDLKIVPAIGHNYYNLNYYELKNFGVQHSHGDIILFIDSDVIPDDGWLTSFLELMKRPEIGVISGHTYLTSDSFTEKAFSLFWLFPPKGDNSDQSYEKRYFHGNNMAIRREIIEANPFPRTPTYRGQGYALSDKLRFKGLKFYFQPKARVEHPIPNGLCNFVSKAICWGHDMYFDRQLARKVITVPDSSYNLNNRRSLSNRRSLRLMISKIRYRHRYVDLNPITTIGALAIIFSYLTLTGFGFILSSIRPELIRNHFST